MKFTFIMFFLLKNYYILLAVQIHNLENLTQLFFLLQNCLIYSCLGLNRSSKSKFCVIHLCLFLSSISEEISVYEILKTE